MLEDPANVTIPERFEAAALRHADRDALCALESAFTYRAMRDVVHRVAHAVLESGAVPGDRALLLFGHRPEALVALVGTAKSGAIAVPVNASAPRDRREQIRDDAQPACIVTDDANRGEAWTLAAGRVPVIVVDRLLPSPERRWPMLAAADPAFILYTSGSTGRPKGVVQTHRSVLRKIDAAHQVLQTTPEDRIAMFSSYAVGQGFTAVFGALLHGAALCPFDVRRLGLGRMARWLVDQRISIYISSATLFRSLVRTIGDVRCPHLRLVRVGSERVTRHDVEAFRRQFSDHARLLIAYSSTETSTIAMHVVGADEQFPGGVVPVGMATEGVRVSIVDERGRTLPPGVEGEIVVQSAALPLGYWRDPEATAGAYRPVPDAPGERVYHTGDLGRLRPDGRLEHLGRRDRRVKVRGFRIELEEIESVLTCHPAVSRAAVVAKRDRHGDATLVAYVELGADGPAAVEGVRGFVCKRLPDYMVPSTFVVVEALPVSDTGKVILSQLPAPPRDRPALSVAYDPARTPLEQVIRDTWKDVLELDAVGVHDPFLMLGGDSLRAAQIASRVSVSTGVEVLLWELLECSTISRLAELLAVRQAAAAQPQDGQRV